MALNTTIGSVDTESYITVSEADSYLEVIGATAWEDLEEEEKEPRLKISALLLNTLPLRGAKACRDQRLEFPRWWRTDQGYPLTESDYVLYSDIVAAGYTPPIVPQEVKDAQAHLTWVVVHGGPNGNGIFTDDPASYPDREVKSFGVGGSLAVEFETGASLRNYAMFSQARIAALDVCYALLFKWIRKISGGVV